MQKVVVLGASGLVGSAIVEACKGDYDVYGTYYSKLAGLPAHRQCKLDVNQYEDCLEWIRNTEPDIVISCMRGDYTKQLEFHRDLALQLNETNSRLYYFSTTNVFDGDYSSHHAETDIPISQTDYGKFKITCEQVLQGLLGDRAIIIRIPAIWGKHCPRLDAIYSSMKTIEPIVVYADLECDNLLDVDLAKQLRYVIDHALTGVFHLTSTDMMTHAQWYEQLISKLSGNLEVLQYNRVGDTQDRYYFGLITERSDMPDFLRSTSEQMIAYLLNE
ncbi:sugar nucleotide-binding protein [Paenibacillus sp. N1-5-1-14]|uniref:sugar nucleotide-binding protein n=1 Tax=Paenibacillus radicibacter TaxID=2972488 RepID=UPI002159824B|nr:sugar nucleotide-binding protein [Paenibacillus radicibacter]MCR8643833.1 sugar nucleotide-binding protein [Paenibacillus radicibacter]